MTRYFKNWGAPDYAYAHVSCLPSCNVAILKNLATNLCETEVEKQWRAEGGANGATAPGIQKVNLQKFKCCNLTIFLL